MASITSQHIVKPNVSAERTFIPSHSCQTNAGLLLLRWCCRRSTIGLLFFVTSSSLLCFGGGLFTGSRLLCGVFGWCLGISLLWRHVELSGMREVKGVYVCNAGLD